MTDEDVVNSLLGVTTLENALLKLIGEIKKTEYTEVTTEDLGTCVRINVNYEGSLEPWGYVDKSTGNLHPAGDTPEESLAYYPVSNIYQEY